MMLVRKADPEKEPFVLSWLEDNKSRNAFESAEVLKYPRVDVLAAHTNGTTHAIMPVHPVAMLESVGTNPESSTREVAEAMLKLVEATAAICAVNGVKEMMFLSSDKVTDKAAQAIGFQPLKCKVFRMRLR